MRKRSSSDERQRSPASDKRARIAPDAGERAPTASASAKRSYGWTLRALARQNGVIGRLVRIVERPVGERIERIDLSQVERLLGQRKAATRAKVDDAVAPSAAVDTAGRHGETVLGRREDIDHRQHLPSGAGVDERVLAVAVPHRMLPA